MEHLETQNTTGKRLDSSLAKHPLIKSREQAKQLLLKGLVLVNQKTITTPDYKLKENDLVIFSLPKNKIDNEKTTKAIAGDLDINYEDKHLLIVNKQAGLAVHPAATYKGASLVNYLLDYIKKTKTTLSSGSEKNRQGIVHRLDKDTTGLLVVAKDDVTHQALAKQFKAHTVHRKYFCLACGKTNIKQGSVVGKIARHPKKRTSFYANTITGKDATTHWKILQSWHSIHLVECCLETGRTHQVRVQLASIGLPILGDKKYSQIRLNLLKNFDCQQQQAIRQFKRQALHAAELGFRHPITKKDLFFKCELPDDLQSLIDLLNK